MDSRLFKSPSSSLWPRSGYDTVETFNYSLWSNQSIDRKFRVRGRLEGVDGEREKWVMALIVPLLIISRTQNDAAAATDIASVAILIIIVTLLHIKDTKQSYWYCYCFMLVAVNTGDNHNCCCQYCNHNGTTSSRLSCQGHQILYHCISGKWNIN